MEASAALLARRVHVEEARAGRPHSDHVPVPTFVRIEDDDVPGSVIDRHELREQTHGPCPLCLEFLAPGVTPVQHVPRWHRHRSHLPTRIGYRSVPLRDLNRATLARQLLLERDPIDPLTAIEPLVSLQAQFAKPPYTGLWSRIEDFRRDQLTQLVIERKVVRATMMRHTLHLMSARDFARLRMTIQPALSRSFGSIAGRRTDGVDLDALVSTARVMVAESPRTFAEMRKRIAELEPGYDPSALGYAVRSFLPLVQVPSGGDHGFPGIPRYALAEDFLGAPLASADQLRELVLRYLAAFGPASVRDAQIWSGLSGLKQPVDELRSELTQFRDESGRELFDLPGAPRPSPDTPAPARLLPDCDNLMVAHADRTRVVSEEHRRRVSLPAAVVRATFLLDGFVAGTWKLERTANRATR